MTMSSHIQRFAAVGLAALLASCFESGQPLIAANQADFPFGQAVRYTFYEWDKERRTWQPNETGTIRREAGHYLQLDDGRRIADADPIWLKSIGDGYFIAQQKNNAVYIYDLLKIQNDVVYQFGFPCSAADQKYVGQGLLDGFTADERWGNTCRVSSFDKLKQIFLANAAEQNQPLGMFALQRQ
jgi:hypothetical protein